MALVVEAGVVILGLLDSRPSFFICSSHTLNKLVDILYLRPFTAGLKAHPWMTPGIKEEGSLLSG